MMIKWDDVMLPLLGLFSRAMNLMWADWQSHRWIYYLVPALVVWTYSCLIGWLIARFHPAAPRAMVLSFVIFLLLYDGGHIVGEAQSPSTTRVLITWVWRDIGALVSIIFGGTLLNAPVNPEPSRNST